MTNMMAVKTSSTKWMKLFGMITFALALPIISTLSSSSSEHAIIMAIDSIEDFVYTNFVDDNNQIVRNNSHRQLQRVRAVCVNTQRDFWETFSVRRGFAYRYYKRRGAADGTCGQACADVCNHKPCTNDMKIGADDLTCRCLDVDTTFCQGNTFCDEDNEECKCNDRYEGDPLKGCTDIDECKLNACGTEGVATCTNLEGSYTCGCKSGFQFNGTYGATCRDVNECVELGTNPCGANSVCQNQPGTFTCFCSAGFTGQPPSTPCVDVNECATADRCGQFGTCVNTIGGYQCNCNSGFEWPGVNSICVDRNECATNPCTGPNQSCQNTIGSFQCVCTPGYEGFPNCVDVNDCIKSPPVCGPNAVCGNTDGSFVCSCSANFPGGNPPSEPCRKLIAGEFCANEQSLACNVGLECAQLSRSNSTYNCCADASRCNIDKRCCNGAYGQNEACPSGANEDCEEDLSCVRASLSNPAKICCRRFIFVPGLGNVCNN